MDRVLIRISDGYPIEFQSGNAPLGTLMKNAISSGLNKDDFEEKYITSLDYSILAEAKIHKPLRDSNKAKRQALRNNIKLKMNITDKDLEDLKEALR